MATSEHVIKFTADTAEFEADLKRIGRHIRLLRLSANLSLIITFAVAFTIGLALGLVVAA